MRHERGAASNFLLTCIVIILAGILLAKVVPPYVEYYSAKQILASMEHNPAMAGMSRDDIAASFFKRARISDVTDISPDDLTVVKRADRVAFTLDYSVTVHLIAQINLLLNFNYATPDSRG